MKRFIIICMLMLAVGQSVFAGNAGKNLRSPIKSNSSLTLDDVFCDANLGKQVDLYYHDLTNMDETYSQIAEAMMDATVKGGEILGPRTGMNGKIQKYKGKANVYCCKGFTCAGPVTDKLLWIYDRSKKKLSAILIH